MIIRSIDLGYGNVKYTRGETAGGLVCGHFPSIAKAHTGVDRGAGIMTRRNLVPVESGGSTYLVGPDSEDTLSARDERCGHLLQNYLDTPQYLALFKGALAYMGTDNIDLLVSGLPVDHYARDKDRLRNLLVGGHHFPDGKSVVVKDAWVVPQPSGGFVDYFVNGSQAGEINDIKSLTIDVGYFTLDWLTCRGLKMQEARSGSTNGGMSMILEQLAALISADRRAPFSDLGIVDAGIRNGYIARIQGKPYDFSHLVTKMESHVTAAVQPIVRSVGSLDDIDVIILVGGGASCYKNIVTKLLDGRDVIVPGESIYSNVRGFYRLGKLRSTTPVAGS